MRRDNKQQTDCPWLGTWITSREIYVGQICCHPYNLDERGKIHLKSKTCEEWDICPVLNKQMHCALR